MISNRIKYLILIGVILMSAGISFVVSTDFRTDPIPPEVRTGWYLPQRDIMWTSPGSGINLSSSVHLILTGWRNGPAPQFPELSPYCRYENYTQQNTGQKYVIAVWYFDEERRFLAAQRELADFLSTSGKITTVELNFTSFPTNGNQSGDTMPNSYNNEKLPPGLTTTGYESASTTGLFFTVDIPGPGNSSGGWQASGNDEHYIVYYGTTDDPANLSSQTTFLREFIGKTYAYDGVSTSLNFPPEI
jgi:hypothetical protein